MRAPRLNRLNAEQKARDLEYLRQMVSEGLDVEIPKGWIPRPKPCPLQVWADPDMSRAFNLWPGQTGYVLHLHLEAQSDITLVDYALDAPFHDLDLYYVKEVDTCRFGPFSYPVKQLLNDRLENPLPMTRGKVLHGILLALGNGDLTEDVKTFDVTTLFVDSLNRQVTTNVAVAKEVWAAAPKWDPPPPGRIRGLYDENHGLWREGQRPGSSGQQRSL